MTNVYNCRDRSFLINYREKEYGLLQLGLVSADTQHPTVLWRKFDQREERDGPTYFWETDDHFCYTHIIEPGCEAYDTVWSLWFLDGPSGEGLGQHVTKDEAVAHLWEILISDDYKPAYLKSELEVQE